MNKAKASELNRRLLTNYIERRTDSCAEEVRLAADQFYCQQRHEVEHEQLFRRSPQVVAFSAEVSEPGDYLALQVGELPVLLSRDEAGKLHAFINACSHRGARLAEKRGNKGRFICPFHGWAFSSSGTLMGRPSEEAFSSGRDQLGLSPLPLAEIAGIIVLGLSDALSQCDIEQSLLSLEAELADYGFADYQIIERREYSVNANWKLVTDLSLESYHFPVAHRDSVAEVLAPNAIVDTFGQHSRWGFPLKTISRLRDLPEDEWPDSVEGSITYTLFPSVMVIANASGAQMIRTEPGASAGVCQVSFIGIAAVGTDIDAARAAYEFGGDVFEREDLPMAELCQTGLQASQRPLIVGTNEPLLQFWHRQWQQFVDQLE